MRAMACVKPFNMHNLIPGMLKEMNAYITACNHFTPTTTHDRKGEATEDNEAAPVGEYTKEILGFWAAERVRFPTWAKAAQMVFALRLLTRLHVSVYFHASRECLVKIESPF